MRTTAVNTTNRGFTLVEVLAALLFMAIIIPVAMEGMSISTRAGILGQRKANAMRIAENIMNEQIVTGQTDQNSASGSVTEGGINYPWTMQSTPWTEDAMTQLTVTVNFDVQGSTYSVSVNTLFDPATAGVATQ